jgi:hypothetical protein
VAEALRYALNVTAARAKGQSSFKEFSEQSMPVLANQVFGQRDSWSCGWYVLACVEAFGNYLNDADEEEFDTSNEQSARESCRTVMKVYENQTTAKADRLGHFARDEMVKVVRKWQKGLAGLKQGIITARETIAGSVEKGRLKGVDADSEQARAATVSATEKVGEEDTP